MAAVCCPFIPTSSAQMRPGENTRIDYINANGERFWSTYADPGRFISFQVYGDTVSGFNVRSSQTINENTSPVRIRFVRPGEESYPLTVKSENEDVKISYEIVSDQSTRSGDIPYGATVKITVTVPNGTYPKIGYHRVYTGTSTMGDAYTSYYSSLGVEQLTSMQYMSHAYEKSENRTYLIDEIEKPWGWERNSTDSNKWYFTVPMPNEPLEITASCVRPDYAMLRSAADYALSELYRQHDDVSFYSGNNGEGSIMSYVGNNLSQDYVNNMTASGLSMDYLYHSNYIYDCLPWFNAFSYINHANLVLTYLDRFTDATEAERKKVRGQMLVLRSQGYLRLLQCYGPRWSDKNRSRLVAPLYTAFTAEDLPLATMEEIYAQCREDLIEAENILYENRNAINEPTRNVARGVRLRFEMLAENWTEVTRLAESILSENPLTTNEELKSGFMEAKDSWIWGSDGTLNGDNILYYWSWGAINACNGVYPAMWGIGAGAIDKDLYLSIPETDVRRSLFVMPDRLNRTLNPYNNMSGWYNSDYMDVAKLTASQNQDRFINYYRKSKPGGAEYSAFTYDSNKVPVQFGAQVKFYGKDVYSSGHLLLMRSDEVYLSAIEAAINLGDRAKATELLNTFNTMRNPEGQLLTPDSDLPAELRKARRIELWGEGHGWFDQKRWSMPITRRHWIESDETSGNWYPVVCNQFDTDYANGWRFAIPAYIVKWNPNIDINALGYEGVEGYETQSPSRVSAPKAPGAVKIQTATVIQEMQPAPSDLFKTVED